MALTIGLRGKFSLCTFGSPHNLGGKKFVSFNVDLVLLRMLLFPLGFWCDCISWIFVKLLVYFIREKVLHLFLSLVCSWLLSCCFCWLKADDVCVSVQVLEGRSCLVMFGGEGLALERILVTSLQILLGKYYCTTLLPPFFFRNSLLALL